MRFKIVLFVQREEFGNVLPVSYQYELSSCIYRKLTENRTLYQDWLRKNGFEEERNLRYKLFSVSNFYVPKIKVEEDRLHILAKKIQLWISFLPERGTEEYIKRVLENQELLIGDRISQVRFTVESVEEIRKVDFAESVDYLSLSPIVVSTLRMNRSIEYIGPYDDGYCDILLDNILEKYYHFYGHEFPYNPQFRLDILNDPKRKGIFIKRFSMDETKVIGFMYKFRLTMHPTLQHLVYNTGLGDKVGLGFGCVEVIRDPN